MYKFIFFSALYLLFSACGDTSQVKLETEKWETVMKQHDVVMPLMSDINKVKKE